MVFAAGVNSLKIEPIEDIVPKDDFADYDENIDVQYNTPPKLEYTNLVIHLNMLFILICY